jgi:tRNA A-37 threonylcarbamoyl transferase component Bud32
MFSVDDAGLLQRRVALFGLTLGAVSLGGFALRVVIHLLRGEGPETLLSPAWGAHLVACLLLLGLWGALQQPRPRVQVMVLEAAALWGAALCYQHVGSYLENEARPDYVVILTMNFLFVARAAYVPSTPQRTALLTGLVGIPLIVAMYLDLTAGELPLGVPEDAPITRSWNAAIWWSFVTIICTLLSHTIYGLRREVRRARQLGQYHLDERIASGGMGEVYRAHHAMLRRPTAVKLIRGENVGEHALARFEQEAQATARLTHPNTVTVFDFGRTDDGVFYYAMEYLDGTDLQTLVEVTGPMPVGRAVAVMAQVASALAEAHAAGLIHRDIKPGNILLVERGGMADMAKVVDFGLVKDVEGDPTKEAAAEGGRIVGTPLYLSPEAIAQAETVDARSDLYALGCVAYFLLTGHHVFDGQTPMAVYSQHLAEDPVPPSERCEAPIPAMLERLVLDLLEKNPAYRPQAAEEVRVRLLAAAEMVTPWDEHDAKRWWAEHRDALRRARDEVGSMSEPQAITIAR